VDGVDSPVLIPLRWAGTCTACGIDLPRRTEAWWDKSARSVTCRPCAEGAVLAIQSVGTAGGSARRIGTQRKEAWQESNRRRFGRLAPVVEASSEEPRSSKAWSKGAHGEALLGAKLERGVEGVGFVLHDRRVPRSRANLDHVVVVPSGIWVVDAKAYSGEVKRKTVGGLLSAEQRLYVGSRDCTKLLTSARKQLDVVANALGGGRAGDLPLRAAICFVGSQWGWFSKPFELHHVLVTWPDKLVERIREPGPLEADAVEWAAARLAVALPSA
jgi:hypothetical protein